MEKIAIDIALIPPENILDMCIGLHNSCKNQRFQLWKNDFIPHISLRLMWIYERDLDKVIEIVSQIDFTTMSICLTWIGGRQKEKWYYNFINIDVDNNLIKLHQEITNKTLIYFKEADNSKMLVDWEKTWFDESAKRWINNFYTEHSFKKYNPHISLWCYDLDYSHIHFPVSFECSRLCIFQIWNINTCRKLLWEKNL